MDNKETIETNLRNEAYDKHKPIHHGKIVQIAKTANYMQTKNRLFVIECDGVNVFLNEEDATDEIKALKKAADLVGKEVAFKVKSVHAQTRQVYVTAKVANINFESLIENREILKGRVTEVYDDHIIVDYFGNSIVIPEDEYYYTYFAFTEKNIGKLIKFVITKCDGDHIEGSRKIAMEIERDKLIERLKKGEEIEATVILVRNWGLRLLYEGHLLVLRDRDFSLDFTKTRSVYKVGDKIKVKLNSISYTKVIFVEPIEKYNANAHVDVAEKYKEDEVYMGEVVTVSTSGIFVHLEQGVDALCPIPFELREPSVGERVMVTITKIIPEKNKLRGKIVSIPKEDTELNLGTIAEAEE